MMTRNAAFACSLTVLFAISGAASAASLAPLWVSEQSAGHFDLGEGAALASDGGVYATGVTDDGKDKNIATMRFSPSGELVWLRHIDVGAEDRGEAIAATADGGAVVAATVRQKLGDDVKLYRYDAGGSIVWSVTLDKGTAESARSVVVAHDGSIYVAGASLSQNGVDGFVVKFDANGTELWSRPINVFYLDEAFAVAVAPDGRVAVTGRVMRDMAYAAFVRQYAANGTLMWTRYVADTPGIEGRGITVDHDGNIYMSGTKDAHNDVGATMDVLIVKFDADGVQQWSRAYDMTGGRDEGRGAHVDASGNPIVVGFGGVGDAKRPFIFKVDPTGEELWRYSFEGTGVAGIGAVDVSEDGARIAVAGATQADGTAFDYLVAMFDQGAPMAGIRVGTGTPSSKTAIAFEDASFPGRVPIRSYTWDFGDGVTSTAANPQHTYAWGGTYKVTLRIVDTYGNADGSSVDLTVSGLPKVQPSTPGAGTVEAATGVDDPDTTEPAPAGRKTNAPSFGVLLVTLVGAAAWVRARRH